MEFFKEKFSENLMALIYIIMGLLMLINPKFVCDAVNYIIGITIMIVGIIFLIKSLQSKGLKRLSKIELLIILLCLGLGLFLVFNSNLLISILPISMGILISLDALSQIIKSFKLRKMNIRFWYINLLVGLIFLLFASYIIINATSITHLIVRLIGLILVIDGIIEIYTCFKFREYNDSMVVMETEIVQIKKK